MPWFAWVLVGIALSVVGWTLIEALMFAAGKLSWWFHERIVHGRYGWGEEWVPSTGFMLSPYVGVRTRGGYVLGMRLSHWWDRPTRSWPPVQPKENP